MPVDPRLLANAIRALAMDAVQAANSGHPGMPMGMADAATILFTEYLKFDPQDAHWHDRDRFVLSAGHGSMLIYSLLHLTGYESPTIEDIRNFRQIGSVCAGHPENFLIPGVEATTGPLGQGFAMAVGMAVAERHLNAVFGNDLVDHRSWVIAGDGDLMEGINHEAVGLAGHLGLGRLNVLWDNNKITIDGATDLSTSEDIPGRYRASGWHVASCDGHDFDSIRRALDEAVADPRPSLIDCRTIIGWGAPNKMGTAATHGAALGPDEVKAAREHLVWDSEPFDLPGPIVAAWREAGARGGPVHEAWRARLAASPQREEFVRRMDGRLPADLGIGAHIQGLLGSPQKIATRKASEAALEAINGAVPETIGGSADLTGSNNTKTKAQKPLTKGDYSGRYIYYGIREFGMAAAMNGMALHGGVIPYGGTFLVFSDYCRPAIRLSALQQARVVYVMTHDSIGLGEDGPTHQPVEHVMSLRMIPNLAVFRPADAVETAECWELALRREGGPSLLALTRQNLPQFREGAAENLCARGAYRIRAAQTPRRVVLTSTGSEVEVALRTAEMLEEQGIGADVVSMPCWSLFDAQDPAYRAELLPEDALKVSIEAGTTLGWERYVGPRGLAIGLDRFGASAPAEELFKRDSVHGPYAGEVRADGNDLIIDGRRVKVTAEKDPAKLPHGGNGVDIALECTGFFTDRDKAGAHLTAGAKKVLISAPAKGVDLTVVYGVNHDKLTAEHTIVSNASCTTNCLAPVAKVLNDAIGIERGLMTTIHAYTNDQKILDQIHKDMRRARAAAMSMIPTTTGAARAVGEVLPELKGRLDGSSIRVPTPNVSVVDLTFTPKRETHLDEVNGVLKAASESGPLQGILAYSEEPLVSIDYNHNPASSTVDSLETAVIEGKLVRVLSWYDNEWGFSNRMVDTAGAMARLI